MNNNIEMLLINFLLKKMELPSKLLKQIAFNTRLKIEEHLLVVMDKSTHEEHLDQPLQTNNKQFKIAVTFLTVYDGNFNITNLNKNFISRNQLLTKILFKSLYQQVLMKSRV